MFALELLFLKLRENTILRLGTALGLGWAEPLVMALGWDHGPVLLAPEAEPWAHSRLAPADGLKGAWLFS